MAKNHKKETNKIVIERKFSKDKVKALNLVTKIVAERIIEEFRTNSALIEEKGELCFSGAESMI